MTRTPLAWVSLPGINPSLPGDVIVYHLDQEKIIRIIPVGIDPRHLAWFPERDKVYVPNCGSNTISVLHGHSLSVEKNLSVGKCPKTIALDPVGLKGYVANYGDNSLSVIDLDQDEVIATIPVGLNPIGLVLSGDGKRLYVTQQASHSFSIIDTDLNQVVATVPLGAYPNALALGSSDDFLYIVITGEHRVSVIDVHHLCEIASIPVGLNPQRIVLHPTRPLAYVTNFDSNSISIFSTLEQRELTTISSLVAPFDLTLAPDGSKLWVTHDYQLTLIDTETETLVSSLNAPPSAQIRQGIAYSESSREFTTSEVSHCNTQRPYAFVTEKIYFKPPKPFDITLHLEFPTPTAKAERLYFESAEVKLHSVSLLPIPLRPNYYHLTFAFRIPFKVVYKDHYNQSQELHDAIHHVESAVEIHLPPSRFSQNLNLRVTTQSEVIGKSVPTPNFLDLTLRTQIIALQQVQVAE